MQKEEFCTNYAKLSEFQKEIDEKNNNLEEKMKEWEELNEKLELCNVE